MLKGVSNALSGIYVQHDTNAPPEEFNAQSQISVRNGGIDQWNDWGINASNAAHSSFSVIGIFNNQHGGMLIGEGCTLSECAVGNNAGPGVKTGRSAMIKDCKAMDILLDGAALCKVRKYLACIHDARNISRSQPTITASS